MICQEFNCFTTTYHWAGIFCLYLHLGFLFLLHSALVKFLCSKGKLGDHIGLCGPAVERIVLGGDIHIVTFINGAKVILHMETIALGRFTLDVVALSTIEAFQPEAVLRIMGQLGFTKAMIVMGHIGSEREGMRYLADLLQNRLPEMEVSYFECGEVYEIG